MTSRALLVLMLAHIVTVWLDSPQVAFAAEPGFDAQSAQSCLDCHENSGVMGILETKHADFENPDSPAAQAQCQSCHGPSDRHSQFPMQVANLRFGKASTVAPRLQNEQCLACHESGDRADWKASAHGYEDMVCSTCHAIHQPDRIVPKAASVDATCNDSCHTDLMAGADPSAFTHPEGSLLDDGTRINCVTCHNPHGRLESTRCLECHAQTDAVLLKQSEKAQRFHETATEKGTECIRCHKGLAHPIAPLETGEKSVHGEVGPVSLR